MTGKLWGIGVGPGDPELLTLKAVRLLGEVDVVASLAADGRDRIARTIVAPYLPPGQHELLFAAPMRADRATRETFYDEVAEKLATQLDAGLQVGFLCLGDPLFYGSFVNLLARLGGRYPCAVIPGITAMSAAAAAIGTPLAHGSESVAVLPGTLPDAELVRRLESAEVAVILKLGQHLPRIRRLLERQGLVGCTWIASELGSPRERVSRLADWRHEAAPYMSLLLLRRQAPGP
ncbi:Cobalamin biosynthesis protein CobIJ [bacterium HR40]|nr:Cobalamin biosynthesis protein CobIJ [bacterium HR40]